MRQLSPYPLTGSKKRDWIELICIIQCSRISDSGLGYHFMVADTSEEAGIMGCESKRLPRLKAGKTQSKSPQTRIAANNTAPLL